MTKNAVLGNQKSCLYINQCILSQRHCSFTAKTCFLLCFFDFILYVPLPVMWWRVFLGSTSTKQGLMCLAQEHNAVTPVRLKPAAPRSESALYQWATALLRFSRDAVKMISMSEVNVSICYCYLNPCIFLFISIISFLCQQMISWRHKSHVFSGFFLQG